MSAPIYIDIEKTAFAPGETIRGKVLWVLDQSPERFKLTLGWWTEGKGSRDSAIAAEMEWETADVAGQRDFEFKLPHSPYSCSGRLVSLQWALEVSVENGPEPEILDIVVSPTGVPVELPLVDAGRSNPFRSSAIAEICYRMDAETRRELVERVRRSEGRGSIVGPQGTGKTTLLEDLEPVLRDAGYLTQWIRLTLDSTRCEQRTALREIAQLGKEAMVLFDGGEVPGWLYWRRLINLSRRRGFGLLATLHQPRGLPVIFSTQANLDDALSLVRQLAPPADWPNLEPIARQAFLNNNGNVREVFRACYWACAESDRD